MRFASVFALLLVASAAQALPLGPGNPPPGANDFRKMSLRAEWIRDAALKVAPEANGRCIYAVALELAGLAELAWSDDVRARGSRTRTVRRGEAEAFRRSLRENAEQECNDRGGPPGAGNMYETVRGLLSFAGAPARWEAARYETLKADVLRAVQGLGLLVPAAEGGAMALPTVALPILNPELFMPKPADRS